MKTLKKHIVPVLIGIGIGYIIRMVYVKVKTKKSAFEDVKNAVPKSEAEQMVEEKQSFRGGALDDQRKRVTTNIYKNM